MSYTHAEVATRNIDGLSEQQLDIFSYKGDTLGTINTDFIEFVITEDDGVTPIDLSGSAVRIQLKTKAKSSNVSMEWVNGDGNTDTSNLVNGVLRISRAAADMAALRVRTYFYDIEFTLADARVWTPLRGQWIHSQDVSREIV